MEEDAALRLNSCFTRKKRDIGTGEMDRSLYLSMRKKFIRALVEQSAKRIVKSQMTLKEYKEQIFRHTPSGSSGMSLPEAFKLKGRKATMSKRVAAELVGIDQLMDCLKAVLQTRSR